MFCPPVPLTEDSSVALFFALVVLTLQLFSFLSLSWDAMAGTAVELGNQLREHAINVEQVSVLSP